MENDNKVQSSGGGCGCLTIIFSLIIIWALVFGVTIGGKHYELSCTFEKGVVIDHNRSK